MAEQTITSVDNEEDDESKINVDRYLHHTVDRQPSSLDNLSAENAPKVELKQLPARLKYAFSL